MRIKDPVTLSRLKITADEMKRTKSSWQSMKQRCNNPGSISYRYYGGLGISYCSSIETFEGFFLLLGVRPEGTSLDREDPEEGYYPGNCRWACRKVQSMNKRGKVYDGEDLKDLEELFNPLSLTEHPR